MSPENTLASIKLAQTLGLKWIEVDVKISKDEVPILLHDDTLDRTTNGKGLPTDHNYEELKKLDAGSYFYKESTNIYIPTLEEILSFCRTSEVGINIELKPNKGFEKKTVKSIIKLLDSFDFKNPYYFSSFDKESIIYIKEELPSANCGLLIDKFNKNISLKNSLEFCRKYKFSSCGLNKKIVTPNIIKEIKNSNLFITVYSEENFKVIEAQKLWDIGVQSIFIDDPSKFNIF